VNRPRFRFPLVVSLCGAHLLGKCLFTAFVSQSLEALAFEHGEPYAVARVGEVKPQSGC